MNHCNNHITKTPGEKSQENTGNLDQQAKHEK